MINCIFKNYNLITFHKILISFKIIIVAYLSFALNPSIVTVINRKNVTACDKCKFWLYKENLYKDKFSDRIRRVCLVHIYVWSSCVPKFDEASLGNVLFLETCCLNFLFLWQRVNEFVAILRENSRAIIRVLDKVKDTKILKSFFSKKGAT